MRVLPVLLLLACNLSAAPPTLTYLYPAGGKQGTTVEVSAGGSFEPWPVKVWTDGKALDVKPGKKKGTFSVAIAADAPTGAHWLRLFNADGASELRPFIVGTLAEVLEVEPNNDPKEPQKVSGNVVVNGRLNPNGDVDHFAVEFKKGQTLVASLEANAVLRSPMDAILQVLSADGFVLAENHDVHGLDPQIVFPVPRDGKYLVRLFAFPSQPDTDIRFAGGQTYVYRLALTTGGFADHAFPLAVSLKQPGPVELRGWNIPTSAKKIDVKPVSITERLAVRHPDVPNPVDVRVESHACVAEVEPNDRTHPQQIEIPVTVSGHIDPARDIDVFEFTGKKGQALAIQVEARTIGSALDPVLRFTDGTGKLLNELTTPAETADPKLNVTIAANGKYRVEVRDQQSHGGERHFYRLRILTPVPDYSLSVAADQFTLSGSLEVPVTIERSAGYAHPIEIKAVGLPEGVDAAPVTADAKAKMVKLKLDVKAGAASKAFRIVGSSPGIADSERKAHAKLAALESSTETLFLTVKGGKK